MYVDCSLEKDYIKTIFNILVRKYYNADGEECSSPDEDYYLSYKIEDINTIVRLLHRLKTANILREEKNLRQNQDKTYDI